MKNTTIKRTIVSTIAGAILVSSMAVGAVTASAKSVNYDDCHSPSMSYEEPYFIRPQTFTFKATGQTSYGYDWTYKATNNNIKVKVKYDFNTHRYTFKLKGLKAGRCDMTLIYYKSDKQKVSVPLKLSVDPNLNVVKL